MNMRICGICKRKSLKKLPRDMFVDKIGNDPPILISELLMKFISDVDLQFVSNEICRNCTRKISQYYSAKQLMDKIQAEIIELIQSKKKHKCRIENDCDMQNMDSFSNAQSLKYEVANTEVNDLEKEEEECTNEENLDNNDKTTDGKSLFIDCDLKELQSFEYETSDNERDDKTVPLVEKKSTIDCSNSIGVPTFRSTGKGKPTGIKCEFCDKVYENHKTFQAHKKYGYGFSGYVCELCGTTLYSKSGFTIHTKSHQAQKEFQCTECGAQFHRKTKLTHHLAWHKGEKPFQCEICAKCFVHRVALTKHRHIHSDATRRNECKICGNKFRTLTHLTRHMTIHTGAKPFSCPICGKCFSQAYNMKTHIKQHENPSENTFKRYRCLRCLKTFVRSIKYEEHAIQCIAVHGVG